MGRQLAAVSASEAGTRLDALIVARLDGVSRARVKRALDEGRVTVNGRPLRKAGARLKPGDEVAISLSPPRLDAPPVAEALPLRLIYEDAAVAVVDKDPGVVVHPAPGHAGGTLVNALMYHLGTLSSGGGRDRPGIVHRIDKDTSGLLVVAKSDAAQAGLQAQFAAHTVHRRYRAVAFGPRLADEGTIETLFGRHRRDRKRMSGRVERGKRACTHWRVLARGAALVVVELALETGRTHQIRVHLSEAGHPLVADPIYGRSPARGGTGRVALELAAARRMPRLALHAAELGFIHPISGEVLRFEAPDPPDLAALIAAVISPSSSPG